MTPATYHPTHSRTLPPPDQGNVDIPWYLLIVCLFVFFFLVSYKLLLCLAIYGIR